MFLIPVLQVSMIGANCAAMLTLCVLYILQSISEWLAKMANGMMSQ